MNILIFGLARSGTKAVYSLVQRIFEKEAYKYSRIYEPFLWDWKTFNGPFDEVKSNFIYNNAISVDGCYAHQKSDLFFDDPCPSSIAGDYISGINKELSDSENSGVYKFIRAHGRIRLILNIMPDSKILFIIRNPLDSVHSLCKRFSYFGGEFHHDDRPRFFREASALFGFDASDWKEWSFFKQELMWWKYMNLFAIDTLLSSGLDFFPIVYEEFTNSRDNEIRKLCEFLNFEYSPEFLDSSLESIGLLSQNKTISDIDLSACQPFLKDYEGFISKLGKQSSLFFHEDELISHYEINKGQAFQRSRFYGRTALNISKSV